MKKKLSLLLPLLALPLLTSCPAGHDEEFFIVELESSKAVFPLSKGLDLTINFGFYKKNENSRSSYFMEQHFMFFVGYGSDATEWKVIHDIQDKPIDCYWTGYTDLTYSKTAKAHIDSGFFVPTENIFTISLCSVEEYVPGKDSYSYSELGYSVRQESYYYSVTDDSNINVYRYESDYRLETPLSVTSSEEL